VKRLALCLALAGLPAQAQTPQAREFVELARQLESVHCERRKLRREIALAEAERREAEARSLRQRFEALGRDPQTAKRERRLEELARHLADGKGGVRDPEDLQLISLHQRQAFYRCE